MKREAEGSRDSYHDKVDDLIAKGRGDVSALQSTIRTKFTIIENWNRFIASYEELCNSVIARYRDENTRYRESPPPRYFREQLKVLSEKRAPDDPAADDERLSLQRRESENIVALREDVRNALTAQYNVFLNKLEGVESSTRRRPPA